MTAEYTKQALADLDQIEAYYRRVAGPRLVEQFEQRFGGTIARISKRPTTGRAVLRRSGVRVALMVGFPYKVFYRVLPGGSVRVVHIRHMSRRPWSNE